MKTTYSLLLSLLCSFTANASPQRIIIENTTAKRVVASDNDTSIADWNIFVIGTGNASFAEIKVHIAPLAERDTLKTILALTPLRLRDRSGAITAQAQPVFDPFTGSATVTFSVSDFGKFKQSDVNVSISCTANTSKLTSSDAFSIRILEAKIVDPDTLTLIPTGLPQTARIEIQGDEPLITGISYLRNKEVVQMTWRGNRDETFTTESSTDLLHWSAIPVSINQFRVGEFSAFLPILTTHSYCAYRVKKTGTQPLNSNPSNVAVAGNAPGYPTTAQTVTVTVTSAPGYGGMPAPSSTSTNMAPGYP